MRRIINGLSKALAIVAGFILVGLIVLAAADVASRNLLGTGIAGAIEWSEVLLPILALAAMGETQKRDAHVSAELLTTRVTPQRAALIEGIGLVLVSAALLVAAYASVEAAYGSYQSGELRIGLKRVPVWPSRVGIALGFISLVLQIWLRAIDVLRVSRRSDGESVAGKGSAGVKEYAG